MPGGKDTQRAGTPEAGSTGDILLQWMSFWLLSRGGLASALQEESRNTETAQAFILLSALTQIPPEGLVIAVPPAERGQDRSLGRGMA